MFFLFLQIPKGAHGVEDYLVVDSHAGLVMLGAPSAVCSVGTTHPIPHASLDRVVLEGPGVVQR